MQPLKAASPTCVASSPSFTRCKEEQPLKAKSLMYLKGP